MTASVAILVTMAMMSQQMYSRRNAGAILLRTVLLTSLFDELRKNRIERNVGVGFAQVGAVSGWKILFQVRNVLFCVIIIHLFGLKDNFI